MAMASALRRVAHEDRLSLVEHLTELRVRLIICIVAFTAATVFCMVENQRILDILNRPLTTTVKHGADDPLEQLARFDAEIGAWAKDTSAFYRRLAPSRGDAAGRGARGGRP